MRDASLSSFVPRLALLAGLGLFVGCRTGLGPPPAVAPGKADVSLSRFASDVVDADVRGEYPRPSMRRARWQSLNGTWEYAVRPRQAPAPGPGESLDGTVRVPFPIESPLSGVGRSIAPDERLFYRRSVTLPEAWMGDRILLHFGAVDWETEVTVGGRRVGWHRGGYDAFSCDVTEVLRPGEPVDVLVAVWDPSNDGGQPRGRQGSDGRDTTGIWQSVWLEPVSPISIDRLHLQTDATTLRVRADMRGGARGHSLRVSALIPGAASVVATSRFDGAAELVFDAPRPWSPVDPHLYGLLVELVDENGAVVDAVDGTFGLRAVSVAADDDGRPRIHLNGQPVEWRGVIDDGWWPGGGPTPPTDAACLDDLRTIKSLGFDVVRVRQRVACERFYRHCDELGLVVFQDMPEATNASPLDRAQWRGEFEQIVVERSVHPSIVMWTPFDEDRGAHDVEGVVRWLSAADPTRLIDASSGGRSGGLGDVIDVHGDRLPVPDPKRALVLGSFGGLDFDDESAVAVRLEEVWRGLHSASKGRAVSAAIWNRFADGPGGRTGLVSADRSTMKVDHERFLRLLDGLFPPTLAGGEATFFDATVVELKSDRDDVEIRYSVDGSLPGPGSAVYDGPLAVTESTVLIARAFSSSGAGSWPARFEFASIETAPPFASDGGEPGLDVRLWFGGVESFGELDSRGSDVEWKVDGFELEPAARARPFAATFAGAVRIPLSGFWSFRLAGDGPTRLFIAGEQVAWSDSPESAPIALGAGLHRIRLDQLASDPNAQVSVEVEGPNGERRQIPVDWLRRDA